MLGTATFPALLPTFISDWELSNADAGWINGIFFAGYLIAVPFLSALTDRMQPFKIYWFCMLLTATSSLCFGIFASGFWSAIVFRIAAGIGLAGTYMPGLKLLHDLLDQMEPDKDHSRAVAFYTASFGIGTSMSFFAAGELASLFGWQAAFIVAALGPVVGLLIILRLTTLSDTVVISPPDTHFLDFRPVLRCPAVMAYVLAYTAHNFELFAFRSWLVAFLVFSVSTGPDRSLFVSATAIAALVNLLGLPASVIGNELARHIGRHRAITIIMLVSAVFACVLGFSASLPIWIVLSLTMIYGITVAGDSASITAGVLDAAPEGYRGATMAVHSAIGFTGAFAGPLLFGIILDLTGSGGNPAISWGWAFLCSGIVVAFGPLALATLTRKTSAS